jgi:hypothetical protein
MKQKACMLMQVKFWLHQEHGIDNAGPTDVYLSLLDPAGYPLTTFRNDFPSRTTTSLSILLIIARLIRTSPDHFLFVVVVGFAFFKDDGFRSGGHAFAGHQ